MKTSMLARVAGRPRKPLCCRVQIRLCSEKCRVCNEDHWSEPMDARRDNTSVQITQVDPVWFGAVLTKNEYRICK